MAKFTLVQDSSSISLFELCPQKWYNLYIKGLEPATLVPDESMNAGTYGHKLLDIYYRLKFRGLALNDIVEACLNYDPDVEECECGCSKEYHCPILQLNIEECRRCRKCMHFRPHVLELQPAARKKIQKRFREYVLYYQRVDDIIPLSEQAVEIGFSEPIYEDRENHFVLEGRIDVIGKIQGLDCFMDHKFQSKTYWLYNKSIQFKNYALISRVPMAVINYVRLTEKVVQNETLTREFITFNTVELNTWHKRLVKIFFEMKHVLQNADNRRNGLGEAPRNWGACQGERLTFDKDKPAYCWYTKLCEEVDPKIAHRKEESLFKVRAVQWRPW